MTSPTTDLRPCTVVLDWDADVDAEPLNVHVMAADRAGAIAAAADEIAAYQKALALDAWRSPRDGSPQDGDTLLDYDGHPTYLQVYAVFPGHLEPAVAGSEPGEYTGYTLVLGDSDQTDVQVLHQGGHSLTEVLDRLLHSSRLPPHISQFPGSHFEIEDD